MNELTKTKRNNLQGFKLYDKIMLSSKQEEEYLQDENEFFMQVVN